MAYLHINNLYADQTTLLFKEVYCLEKIHGTSAHISFRNGQLHFSSGGASSALFKALFDPESLAEKMADLGHEKVTIYGEAYGGKEQGMKETYGNKLKFIVFDVQLDETWLNVPVAERTANKMGLEFVDYVKVATTFVQSEEDGVTVYTYPELDRERDRPSVQAVRNGITEPKLREGIVIRPLQEFVRSNGERVIAKHKGDAFKETASAKKIVDPVDQEVLEDAEAIALEWVTPTRVIAHILDKLKAEMGRELVISDTGAVIRATVEDVYREGRNEISQSKPAEKAIMNRTREIFHAHLKKIV